MIANWWQRSPRNMTRSENPELDAVYDKFKSSTDEKDCGLEDVCASQP
jgi:hypothetical protein